MLARTVALALALLTVPAYAADRLAFACSGFSSHQIKDSSGRYSTIYKNDEVYSFVVDLDRKVVSFGRSIAMGSGDDIPITKITDGYIWFQYEPLSNPYWEGELNRITGSFHLFHRWVLGGNTEDFYLDCKPAKPLF